MGADKDEERHDREIEWIGDSKFRLYLLVAWKIAGFFFLFFAVSAVIAFIGPALKEAWWPVVLLTLFFITPVIQLWRWLKERRERRERALSDPNSS